MRLKYKEREEEGVCLRVIMTTLDEAKEDFIIRQKRNGWFNSGFHYLLHADGSIDTDVPLNNYADPTLPEWRNSIYVLAMGCQTNKLTDSQSLAIDKIQRQLNLPIRESEEVCRMY